MAVEPNLKGHRGVCQGNGLAQGNTKRCERSVCAVRSRERQVGSGLGWGAGRRVRCPRGPAEDGLQTNTPRREITKGLYARLKSVTFILKAKGSCRRILSARVIRSDMCFRKIILAAITHSKWRQNTSLKPLKYSSRFLRKACYNSHHLSS